MPTDGTLCQAWRRVCAYVPIKLKSFGRVLQFPIDFLPINRARCHYCARSQTKMYVFLSLNASAQTKLCMTVLARRAATRTSHFACARIQPASLRTFAGSVCRAVSVGVCTTSNNISRLVHFTFVTFSSSACPHKCEHNRKQRTNIVRESV